jgi:DNA-binding NarL/FixJ family response regulator
VVEANAAGRLLLERAPRETRTALRDAVERRGDGGWSVAPIQVPGAATHHLLVRRGPAPDVGGRLAPFAGRYGLSPRQRAVLAELVVGAANKTIAGTLRIAESTVELHVTALLARVGCESRAALVARFWSEGAR